MLRTIGPLPPLGSHRTCLEARTIVGRRRRSDNDTPPPSHDVKKALRAALVTAHSQESEYHNVLHMPILSNGPVNPLVDLCDFATDAQFYHVLSSELPPTSGPSVVVEEGAARLFRILVARRVYRIFDGAPETVEEYLSPLNRVSLPLLSPSLEELRVRIDKASNSVQSVSGFFYFCSVHEIHDVYTPTFLDAFRTHPCLHSSVVLEVGAGKGRLKAGLHARGVPVVATDILPYEGVVAMDYAEALIKYNPTTVLASWIPYGEDWVSTIERHESVQWLVLMGPVELTGTGECYNGGSFEEFDPPRSKLLARQLVCRYDCAGDVENSAMRVFHRR